MGIKFAFIILGFFSIVSQINLLREFTSTIFLGNELSLGIIFFNWMVTVAAGSFFASFYFRKTVNKIFLYAIFQILSSIILFLQIFIIRGIRDILKISIIEIYGTIPLFFYSFLIIFPLTFILGMEFVLGVEIFKKNKMEEKTTAEVYLLETIGMAIGGILQSYFFSIFLNSFQTIYILTILNFLSCFFLLNIKRKFLIFYIFFLFPFKYMDFLEYTTTQKFFKEYSLKEYKNSIYGKIVVTEKSGQFNFYSNATLISSYPDPDLVHIEEVAHFPLFFTDSKKDILLISGGFGGLLQEILKHTPSSITYLELDPLLVETYLKYTGKINRKIKIVYTDGRFFVKNTKKRFDVIIVNLPPPKTLQINRFYTEEFFREIAKILKEKGIFSFSLPSSEVFQQEELLRIHLSIFKALKEIFPHSILIPGNSLIFIASKKPLSLKDFKKNVKGKKIKTKIFNYYYINYRLKEEKIKFLQKNFKRVKKVEKNSDFKPVSVFYNLAFENLLFHRGFLKIFNFLWNFDYKKFSIITFIFSIAILFFTDKSSSFRILFPLFMISFLGFVQEMILIFLYQTIYGYIYSRIGILICSFMAGMCLGVYFGNQEREVNLGKIVIGFAIYNIFVLVFFKILPHISFFKTFSILVLLFISGIFVGTGFSTGTRIYFKETRKTSLTAGITYAVDLAGSCLGALFSGSLFIPLFGISFIIFPAIILFFVYIGLKREKPKNI